MGMQKSDELAEVVGLMYKQFEELDFGFYQVLVSIYDTKNNVIEWWSRGFGDVELPQRNMLPIIDHPFSNDLLDKWKNGVESYQHILEGEMKKSWDEHLFTQTDLKHFPQEIKDKMRSFDHVFLTDVFMKYGSLQAAGNAPLPADKEKILKRFTKALDHAYTRMMDLQNAEAQTREAQIEAALERVRSKTMAMQRSEELDTVIKTVYSELKHLDISFKRCFIMIFDEHKGATWWMGSPDDDLFHQGFYVQYHTHPPHLAYLKGWEERQQKWEYWLKGQIKKDWDKFIFNETELAKLPPIVIHDMKSFDVAYLAASFENFGCMTTGGIERLSEESFGILNRFAKVFDQTYTRFNDLKQAEAQAREAQIEVALERIRARAMAMHSSNELMDVANILREQMGLLGQPDLETSVVNLFEEDSELIFSWNASRVPGSSEKIVSSVTSFLKNSSELTREMMSLYHSKEKEYTLEAAGLKLMEFLKVLIEANPRVADYIGNNPPEKVFYHFTTFTGGNLLTVSYQPPSEETKSLQRRAASVFDMAYRRYLDLKKAEAQAREAQIEVALERVRAKVMAMTNSKELNATSLVFGEQLRKLNIDWQFSYFWLIDEAKNDTTFWITWPDYKTSFTAYTMDEAAEYFNDCLVAWRGGVKIHDNYVPPEGVQAWLDTFQRIADDAGGVAKEIMMHQHFLLVFIIMMP